MPRCSSFARDETKALWAPLVPPLDQWQPQRDAGAAWLQPGVCTGKGPGCWDGLKLIRSQGWAPPLRFLGSQGKDNPELKLDSAHKEGGLGAEEEVTMPIRLRLELGKRGRGRRRGSRGRQGQVRKGCGQWEEPGGKVRCVCWTWRGCAAWSEEEGPWAVAGLQNCWARKACKAPVVTPEL